MSSVPPLLFYRWGNRGPRRLEELLKATHLLVAEPKRECRCLDFCPSALSSDVKLVHSDNKDSVSVLNAVCARVCVCVHNFLSSLDDPVRLD